MEILSQDARNLNQEALDYEAELPSPRCDYDICRRGKEDSGYFCGCIVENWFTISSNDIFFSPNTCTMELKLVYVCFIYLRIGENYFKR
jgi:hypothetical protein